MHITRQDLLWNYIATFLKIGSSAFLLPFILKTMPAEMVGIWIVFMTVNAFAVLMDFGFNQNFARNITYIFSGVKTLKVNGVENVINNNLSVDYGLLKGAIASMKWIYLRIAIILLLCLSSLGTYYIHILLQNYTGEHQEIYIAWSLLCIIVTYNLYTLYYDSLLQGKGLVKKSKQILIVGNIVYIIAAIILLISGYGLIAIISAQVLSIVIIRWLSYRSFFTKNINQYLKSSIPVSRQEILKAIYPNTLKIGLTSLGSFLVQRAAIIIGSLYLPLSKIASYGITMQLLAIIANLATIYISTYYPKIIQLRVARNNQALKEHYITGQLLLLLTYIIGGVALLLLGEWALSIIESKTQMMPIAIVSIAIIISFLEKNHSTSGWILLTNNEVPFFKASLIAGLTTITLLLIMVQFTNIGLWAMVLVPGIAQLYNNWKWPHEVLIQLDISNKDIMDFCIRKMTYNKR